LKRVYSNESIANVGHVRTLLEHAGIPCFTKNEQLVGALGEVPFLECMPEVWVYDDADEARAQALVAGAVAAPPDVAAPWQCATCGETNDGQFAACWKCGSEDAGTGP